MTYTPGHLAVAAGALLTIAAVVLYWVLWRQPPRNASHPLAAAEVIAVHFPARWTYAEQNAGRHILITTPSKYEVRSAPSAPEELIFGVRSSSFGKPLSEVFFALDGENDHAVHPVSLDVWEAAERLALHQELFDSVRIQTATVNTVAYHGKTYLASGPALRCVLPSADGRWLALLSETVKDQSWLPRFGLGPPFLGGDSPREGDLYLDLFEASTGLPAATGHLHYTITQNAAIYCEDSFWIDSRYLVVPLDAEKRSCFLVKTTPSGGSRR